jgi:hypothetical protein
MTFWRARLKSIGAARRTDVVRAHQNDGKRNVGVILERFDTARPLFGCSWRTTGSK